VNERAVNEPATNGRATNGRATDGKAMNERTTTGQAATGRAANGRAVNGQAASRRTQAVGDAVAATEMPRLVRLDHNLYAACFTVMKLLPARYILDTAIRRGELRPGMTVVETSSGTFGLGLAMVTALRGYPLVLVSDPVLDAPLKARLENLGARVEIVTEPAAVGGHQRARLDRLDTIRKECAPAFVPSQYDNPLNPAAYASVAELVRQRIGPVDTLVGCVGTVRRPARWPWTPTTACCSDCRTAPGHCADWATA
jgi:hypothetical protein